MPASGIPADVVLAFGRHVLHGGAVEQDRRKVLGVAAQAGRLVVSTMLPEVCAGCGLSGNWVCAACETTTHAIDQSSVCRRCGDPAADHEDTCHRCRMWSAELSACRSAFAFEGVVRSTVHLMKYRNQPARASWCARSMVDRLMLDQWEIDVFVPVPLHASRVRVRGYNQSERIAVELSRITGVPSVAALRRVRPTVSQVGLGATERRENVRDAFEAVGRLDGLTVALVDDVVTTGSTLQESARATVNAGATCVVAATFAAEVHVPPASGYHNA